MATMSPDIERFSSCEELMEAAARRFAALAANCIARHGRFEVALAGGSTPVGLYRRLAAKPYAKTIDWQRVHLFWGDERCVAPDHPDSNFGMADEALLQAVAVVRENVHRMRGELSPERAAAEYEQVLRSSLQQPPGFDLVLLGMGEDGHTASLFPGSKAVREEVQGRQKRWVVAEHSGRSAGGRITCTAVPINASRRVLFLVSGEKKAAVLREVLQGSCRPADLPAQLIAPLTGRLTWMVDAPAARLLNPEPAAGRP